MSEVCGPARNFGDNGPYAVSVFRYRKRDYLFRLFEEMEEKSRIVFQESPEQGMFFLSLLDLAELLYKLTDDWENAETAWNIPDDLLSDLL